jgi:hypothetical protein
MSTNLTKHRGCSPAVTGFSLCILGSSFSVHMPAGLVGCSVDPKITRGVHKLARTPQVIYKKKFGSSTVSIITIKIISLKD